MSQSIFQVRPQDAGKGWAIDEYDGRGAWQSTYFNNVKGEPLDKQEAQRRVFQLRRKALNSVKTVVPVNKGGSNECDQCDGRGRYFIDGKPQACICSEPQTGAVNDSPCIQCGLPMNGEHKPDCVWAD